MRLRSVLLTAVPTAFVLGLFVVPLAAHATGIPYFGPIVGPRGSDVLTCAAGWGALADLVNNAIAFLITILILFIAPFMIAWAGFLYVVSPGNPGMRTKASGILLNTAVGIAVALAAWLIVNALLTAITVKDGVAGGPPGGVAEWTRVMFSTTADKCLITTDQLKKEFSQAEGQKADPSLFAGGGTGQLTSEQACADHDGLGDTSLERPADAPGTVTCGDNTVQPLKVAPGTALTPSQACVGSGGIPDDGESSPGAGLGSNQVRCANGDIKSLAPVDSVPLSVTGVGACDSKLVQQYASEGGYSLSSAEANTLACIAQPESECGKRLQNYSWNKDVGGGKASSAYGAFQVLLSTNAACFENSVCYKAAGVTGSLNCSAGFRSGFPTGDQTVLANCTKAAANIPCNTAAAACQLKKQGFSAWTADPSGAAPQKACISKFGG